MFYFKLLAFYLYLLPACLAAMIASFFTWGNANSNRRSARWMAWGVLKLWGVKIVVDHEERLTENQPCIYVGNHQGGMDVILYGWIFPRQTVVVGKKELLRLPLFNVFFLAGGNIPLNRQRRSRAIADLADAADEVKIRKISVFIFPEGTRNYTDEPFLPFKKGAFYMAIQAGVPIVPIVAEPLRPFFHFSKGKMRGGELRMKVLPPIETKSFSSSQTAELSNLVRERMNEAFRSLVAGGAAKDPAPAARP